MNKRQIIAPRRVRAHKCIAAGVSNVLYRCAPLGRHGVMKITSTKLYKQKKSPLSSLKRFIHIIY